MDENWQPVQRFCNRCGAVQDRFGQCPQCAPAQQPLPPPEGAGGRHSFREALGLYFLLLGSSLAMILWAKAQGSDADLISVEFWVVGIDSLIVLVWCGVRRADIWPGLTARFPLYWLAAAVGIAGLTFALATGIITGLVHWLGVEQLELGEEFRDAGYGMGVVFLVVCVQPAIIEELAFRGLILSALGRVLGRTEAIVISAVMFMVLHLSPLAFPHLLVLGVVLAWLRLKTGSLWPGILVHFIHNGLCVVFE